MRDTRIPEIYPGRFCNNILKRENRREDKSNNFRKEKNTCNIIEGESSDDDRSEFIDGVPFVRGSNTEPSGF